MLLFGFLWLNKWAMLLVGKVNKPFPCWFSILSVKLSSEIRLLLICSMITLLTLSSSFFAWLINLHDKFCPRSCLWSWCYLYAIVSGSHYSITSFNKAWIQVLRRFKSCSWRVRDSRWWGSLPMVPNGNKGKSLSSINHTT